MELGASDPATSPTCHRISGHPPAHRKAAGRLGGGEAFHASRGHAANVRGISHRCPEGGDGGAPVTNVSHPGAPWEAPDGGAVDYRAGEGWSPATWGPGHEDREPGDVGAPRQTPGGPDTNRSESGLVT